MAEQDTSSILVADLGSVHTRLLLLDLVEGQYRLVAASRARTTAEPPLSRVALGLEHAAAQMAEFTGHTLLDPQGQQMFLPENEHGQGVGAFLATSSAGRPMRVFLVGLTRELSLEAAQHALAGSYVTITDTLTPDDARSEEAQINALLNSNSDMIFIVGGTDDGAEELVKQLLAKVELALSLVHRGTPPTVLFAGNQVLRRAVKARLEQYTSVFTTKNVRPTAQEEQLFPAQIELALVYDEYRSKSAGGFDAVGRQSDVGLVPTTQGYISAMRYMAALPGPGIGPLCVDVGSANSLIIAGVEREPIYTIRTDLGVGHNIVRALEAVTPARVQQWLPFEMDDEWLRNYVHNKALRPATVPATTEELLIEQALAREIVRELVTDARPLWGTGESALLPHFHPIIAAGAVLTETQHPAVAAMLLLDALQPVGLVDLYLDPHNLIASLGVVAYLRPLVTVQALENGGLVHLGTAFCPLGRVRKGRKAIKVQIRYGNKQKLTHTVRGGEIWRAPLLPGEPVEVRIQLSRGLSFGGKRRLKRRLVTGVAGLIFDARGRPLAMPRPRDRAAQLMAWLQAMSAPMQPAPLPEEELPEEALLPSLEDLTPEALAVLSEEE